MNGALERAGSAARVDHRSYADQGIDRLPGIHLGRAVGLERRDPGVRTRIGDRQREIDEINAEMKAITVAWHELAADGQAQRAALIEDMRDHLGLSRSAAPERSRWATKRLREAVTNPPEIEATPVTPPAISRVPDTRRREASKRRRSSAPVFASVPSPPLLEQSVPRPALNRVEPAQPTPASSLPRQASQHAGPPTVSLAAPATPPLVEPSRPPASDRTRAGKSGTNPAQGAVGDAIQRTSGPMQGPSRH